MMPDQFWSSTLDECLLVFQGKNEERKFVKANTYLIHASLIPAENRVDFNEWLKLDDEESETETDADFYRKVLESGYIEKPING